MDKLSVIKKKARSNLQIDGEDIDWLIKKAEEASKYKKALRGIVRWNNPVIQDYESYTIARDALETKKKHL